MALSRLIPLLLASLGGLWAQTTQGLISGRLLDSVSGRAVMGASVEYIGSTLTSSGAAYSDPAGAFFLPLLSPGAYRLRVTAPRYQAQELEQLDLPVAGRLDIDFRLRPLSDVWESGQYRSVFLPGSKTVVTFYGPDVDASHAGSFEAQQGRVAPLESTVSYVIDRAQLANLPLEGRDVFAMLVTLPGVTSDAGTSRGLGLAINGQRPAASNFLLDGVENNNYLITGPLLAVSPESVAEYRVSTNNYSAEYGRTSGFVANAITLSGENQLHGAAYVYVRNDALNAASFGRNRLGLGRTPTKDLQPGFVLGGPLRRNRLWFSSSFEHWRSRSQGDPAAFQLPTASFAAYARDLGGDASLAAQLLTRFPAPEVGDGAHPLGKLVLAPPVSLDRSLYLERADFTAPGGRDRLMARLLGVRLDRPDFIWTPYPAFVSPLQQNISGLALAHTHTFRPSLTNEARLSYTGDNLHWDRPHPEIPTLVSGDGTVLPGSPAFYAYRNHSRTGELLANVLWNHGRHLVTAGAGALFRASDGYLTAGRDGEYEFYNANAFAVGIPLFFRAAVDRAQGAALVQPRYDRTYRYNQLFAFAQDTFRLSRRLTLNYGLRYEIFGAPSNTGTVKDLLVRLGTSGSAADRVAAASLSQPATGSQNIFETDRRDWAGRAGAAYDLFGAGRTLLRGAGGIFYDRPFDNLWQNVRGNSLTLPRFAVGTGTDYLAPVASVLAGYHGMVPAGNFPDLTAIEPGLRNGRVTSYFAGVSQQLPGSWLLDVNALGSYGANLVATDVVNRQFTTAAGDGRLNPHLPAIAYRGNQGYSHYNALTALLRYRTARAQVQVAYTWSHSIDNQSEPLAGDFFNLTFTGLNSGPGTGGRAAFSRQFDPNADRGNSDFDQRHNLVWFAFWNPPPVWRQSRTAAAFRGWTVAALAACRSGFPFNVQSANSALLGEGLILNSRPDLVDPAHVYLDPARPIDGGKQLLNPAAFAAAAPSRLGTLGRNSLLGPGLANLDFSLARTFSLPGRENLGIGLRADAFNVLNHANLNNPNPLLTDSGFGAATFGRHGVGSSFPASQPFQETGRTVQLSLRVLF